MVVLKNGFIVIAILLLSITKVPAFAVGQLNLPISSKSEEKTAEEKLKIKQNRCKNYKIVDKVEDCEDGILAEPLDVNNFPYSIRELDCVFDTIIANGLANIEASLISSKKTLTRIELINSVQKKQDIDRCPKDYRDAYYEVIDSTNTLLDYFKNGSPNNSSYNLLVFAESFFKALYSNDFTSTYSKVDRQLKQEERNTKDAFIDATREYNAQLARYSDAIDDLGNPFLRCRVKSYNDLRKILVIIKLKSPESFDSKKWRTSFYRDMINIEKCSEKK